MKIDFKGASLPVVIQDVVTNKVLKVTSINAALFEKSIEEKKISILDKGEEKTLSFDFISFEVSEEAVLFKVKDKVAISAFGEKNEGKGYFLNYLQEVIRDRKENAATDDKSYTASLFRKGINKIAQKVGEEAVEVVIEAKDDDLDLFLGETSDLLFHYLVLLEAKEVSLDDVISRLQERHS